VALGGDGGDELFAGYDPFLAHKFSFLVEALPDFILNAMRKSTKYLPISYKNMSFNFKVNHFLKGFLPYTRGNPELKNTVWLGSFQLDSQKCLLNAPIDSTINYESIYAPTLYHSQKSGAKNNIDKVIDNFINLYLQDDILVKTDRASMMHSLEVRAPFLDKRFAEFACRLPAGMKLKAFTRKYILKRSLKDKLPQAIIGRPKKGFGVPFAQWFRGPLKSLLIDTFSKDSINRSNIFNYNFIQGLLGEHLNARRDNRKELWTLLGFELWRKYHEIN
jgi:asparagine synthase (glutamine-hydrolysing)